MLEVIDCASTPSSASSGPITANMALARDDGEDEADRDGACDSSQRPFANGVLDLLFDGAELVLRVVESGLALRLQFVRAALADVGQRAGDRPDVAAKLRDLVFERRGIRADGVIEVFADLLDTAASGGCGAAGARCRGAGGAGAGVTIA